MRKPAKKRPRQPVVINGVRYLTLSEWAAWKGVSYKTAMRAKQNGEIKFELIACSARIPVEVDALDVMPSDGTLGLRPSTRPASRAAPPRTATRWRHERRCAPALASPPARADGHSDVGKSNDQRNSARPAGRADETTMARDGNAPAPFLNRGARRVAKNNDILGGTIVVIIATGAASSRDLRPYETRICSRRLDAGGCPPLRRQGQERHR